eukprot:TRINITY_DN21118_c0_g1_i4.p1 TRINITY_DN21118_c0_g1~~TRINITY_DN21118_c0_g1_i4.p1  ORF type:complete len:375 (-),score=40.96 TRINITY_DN21118_c0_g1_i4:688-1812(-)
MVFTPLPAGSGVNQSDLEQIENHGLRCLAMTCRLGEKKEIRLLRGVRDNDLISDVLCSVAPSLRCLDDCHLALFKDGVCLDSKMTVKDLLDPDLTGVYTLDEDTNPRAPRREFRRKPSAPVVRTPKVPTVVSRNGHDVAECVEGNGEQPSPTEIAESEGVKIPSASTPPYTPTEIVESVNTPTLPGDSESQDADEPTAGAIDTNVDSGANEFDFDGLCAAARAGPVTPEMHVSFWGPAHEQRMRFLATNPIDTSDTALVDFIRQTIPRLYFRLGRRDLILQWFPKNITGEVEDPETEGSNSEVEDSETEGSNDEVEGPAAEDVSGEVEAPEADPRPRMSAVRSRTPRPRMSAVRSRTPRVLSKLVFPGLHQLVM